MNLVQITQIAISIHKYWAHNKQNQIARKHVQKKQKHRQNEKQIVDTCTETLGKNNNMYTTQSNAKAKQKQIILKQCKHDGNPFFGVP